MFCSLAIHFAGCKCWAGYSIWPFKNLNRHARSGQCVIAELFFCGFICKNIKAFAYHRIQCNLQILYD